VAIDLETYRDELEAMTAETLTEYYEHNSGRKPTMEMARIYERYGHLTTRESAIELAESGAPKSEVDATGAILTKIGPIYPLFTIAIGVLMIWKPGSGCGVLLRC